jgi:hypothetical protein
LRASLTDHPGEVAQHFAPFARRRVASGFAEVLARGTADDAVKHPWRGIEVSNIPAPDNVRPPDNAKALRLKAPAQQVDAGENGKE